MTYARRLLSPKVQSIIFHSTVIGCDVCSKVKPASVPGIFKGKAIWSVVQFLAAHHKQSLPGKTSEF